MKEIQIAIRIDESDRMATIIKNKGFDKEALEGILFLTGILENLKQGQLDKLKNLAKKIE